MPLYTYKAIDAAGKSVMGRVDAGNVFDLEQRLSRMGLDLVSGAPSSTKTRLLAGARIPRPDLINFCFHLEQLAGAGVPIVEGLIDLRESVENLRFREVVGGLVETIEGGKNLSGSFMLVLALLALGPSRLDQVVPCPEELWVLVDPGANTWGQRSSACGLRSLHR